jgi:Protein of unknown function (DUF4232)
MTRLLILTLVVLAAGTSASGAAAHSDASCTGAQLTGTFNVVRGSAGAGNITYKLVLKNVSSQMCTLTGLPQGRLLGKTGTALPTHVRAAFAPGLTAILVRLAPGNTTFASARFSPDVPGPGEPVAGTRCEPTAWWLRVTAQGGGTTKVRLGPPTSVCEHGQMLFSAYSTKR